MLCTSCEQRFGNLDEYVADLAYKADGSTPLKTLLPYYANAQDQLVDARKLDVDKLVRFALSVIWRAHTCQELDRVSLGPYGGAFRDYLNETGLFPPGTHIEMSFFHDDGQHLLRSNLLDRVFTLPQSNRDHGNRIHSFYICGLHFAVMVGACRPTASWSATCLHCSKSPRVWVRDSHASGVVDMLRARHQEATPKGKWARLRRSVMEAALGLPRDMPDSDATDRHQSHPNST
jgi:hypothetical protein